MMDKKYLLGCMVLCLLAMSLTASASVTDPNIITAAVAINGTAPEPLVVVNGGLWQGELVFVDRTGVFGDANDLGGLDYVRTAVDDKPDADVQYEITVNKTGTLFLIIDNRVGDNNADDPPTLGGGVMDWIGTDGFTVTPYTVNIDTPGTVYSKPITEAGTIILFAQNDGTSRVMYVVAAAPTGWNLCPSITGVPANKQVPPGGSLLVDGTITDDGIPGTGISVQWTTLSAPEGAVVGYSDDTSEDVTISFSEMGDYTLQIRADDGEKATQKTVQVAVQIPVFAVECTSWCTAGNDSDQRSGSYRHSSIHYARNHSAPRRRIEYVQYDISGQKDADQVYTNSYLTMNRDKGSTNEVLSVFAVREEYDNVDLGDSSTAVWDTLPGVVNSPPPSSSDPLTIESLEQSEISPLLMETTITPLDVWVDTPTSAGLDEFLNADNDGIITLMFMTFSPEDADFEIRSPSKGTVEPVTGLHGIILQGTVMPATWATNPVPGINATQSKDLAELSWTNPPAVGTITCDVYIGTDDPNYFEADYGLTTLATGVSGNSASLAGYTLEVNTTYNWIVDVTDSGTAETSQGKTWNFNTNNTHPTVEMETPYQYLWLNNDGDPASATAVINATASDDGFPNPALGLLWTQTDGPITVAINPDNTEDITLALSETGTYIFKLTANDSELNGSASTEIFVGATPCDAAKAKPEYVQFSADFNNDCYVNLSDLSEFALQWLGCNSAMDAPCVE